MNKEELSIKNFGGLNNIKLELDEFNILIGPQASGKSIIAKLLYFFKNIPHLLTDSAENEDSKRDFDNKILKRFEEYFPLHTWPEKSFSINYKIDDLYIEVNRLTGKKTTLSYSPYFNKTLGTLRRKYVKKKKEDSLKEEFELYRHPYWLKEGFLTSLARKYKYIGTSQYFVPAGRSFYANLQSSIFSFLSSNKAIDPFLIEFGSFYESIKNYNERNQRKEKSSASNNRLFESLLCGKYLRENDKDYLIHKDKRKINLSYASSGQQETLPLALILKALESVRLSSGGGTLFIEEPEAHLFPLAQKIIVEFISYIYHKSRTNLQFIITTHSPYILAALNNLMHAGKIFNENKHLENKIYEIISKDMIMPPDVVRAYSLSNGDIENLICEETKIISQSILDGVSDEIAIQFDKLLDLY